MSLTLDAAPWTAIVINVLSTAFNIWMGLRAVRQFRRSKALNEAILARTEAFTQALMPALAFCSVMADDPHVPPTS